ncbi:uncharacterized protein B0H18DRAFT_982189, partial [Fomitopsis serialis]|uniref:uncharacterized protein n=1 Tax=Fomitopsis serialis TaxID=139415 RepID=UPI00200757ED
MRFTTFLSVAFAAAATPAFALPTNTVQFANRTNSFASRTVEDDSVYAREYDSDLWARRDPRPGLPPQKPVPTYPPPAPPTGGRTAA